MPGCRLASVMAWVMARPTISLVPGWALWALKTTGQPAARAEAVSPPAVEKARGKLEAPNTATGPTGILRWRISTRGIGVRSGSAGSIRTPWWSPWRTTWAKSRSWLQVRPRSPVRRASGSPVSSMARATSSVPTASMFAAMASRKAAWVSGSRERKDSKASSAAAVASSNCSVSIRE